MFPREDLPEHLLHSLGEGVCCLDHSGICVFVNPAAASLLGFQRDELLGRHGHALFECDTARPEGNCECVVTLTMKDGQWRQGEVHFYRRDGGMLPTQLTVSPLARLGQAHSVVIVFRDISQQKRGERQRRALAERLAEQNRIIAHFATCESISIGAVERVAREMTEQAARAFGVDRVGVWLFNSREDALRCISLFNTETWRHEGGDVLLEQHFAPEIEELRDHRYVASENVSQDARMAGCLEEYLQPQGIRSLLDCAILSGGRTLGILSFEYIHGAHVWENDEIAFGCALADQIGMAVLNAERARAQAELQLSEARHRAISSITSDVLFSCVRSAAQGCRLEWVAGSCHEVFGVDEEKLLARGCICGFVHPEDMAGFGDIKQVAAYGESRSAEFRVVSDNGETRHLQVYTKLERDVGGAGQRLYGACRDVTERKSMERELIRMANTDSLTGVANRRRFLEQLEMELERSRRYGEAVSVLILDVDHFKRVNDTQGHAVGDEALRHLARLAAPHLRRNDLFGRLGGEEFGILLPGTPLAGAGEFADRFRAQVEGSPSQAGVRLTISIGVSECRHDDSGIDQVLARADAALYAAKQAGRNRVEMA